MPRLPSKDPYLCGLGHSPVCMIESFIHKRFEPFSQHQHIHAHDGISCLLMLVLLVPFTLILISVLQSEGAIKVSFLRRLVPVEGVGLLWEVAFLLLRKFLYQICLPKKSP